MLNTERIVSTAATADSLHCDACESEPFIDIHGELIALCSETTGRNYNRTASVGIRYLNYYDFV